MNGHAIGGRFHIGNVQGDKGQSLSIDLDSGLWMDFATDEKGNIVHLVQHAHRLPSFDDALALLSAMVDATPIRREVRRSDASKLDYLKWIMDTSKPFQGTAAEAYFINRRLTNAPSYFRFHEGLKHAKGGKKRFPCVIMPIASPERKVMGVHRIYITPDGFKAPVDPPKMAFGAFGGGAIRLAPAGTTLGISEGAETGLAAMEILGLPVWSAVSGGNMKNIVLPEEVTTVVLLADRDPEGYGTKHAEKAAAVFKRKGLNVLIEYPTGNHKDFNDQLMAGR